MTTENKYLYLPQNINEKILSLNDTPWWEVFSGPIAIGIVGVVGWLFASHTIKTNKEAARNAIKNSRDISKKQATMDYLMDRARDDRFVDSFTLMSQIDKTPCVDIKHIADKEQAEHIDFSKIIGQEKNQITRSDCLKAISYILNQYEYMAVSVRKNIYDEDVLIECTKSSTIIIFDIARGYIDEGRSIRQKATQKESKMYSNFESLVEKWRSNQKYQETDEH